MKWQTRGMAEAWRKYMQTLPSLPFAPTGSCEVVSPLTAVRKPGPTILLVDDDAAVRNSVSRVLISEALQVVTARGVKDALEQIFRNTPDLVVTDLCMAPLTGWDLITHLEDRYPAVPIFVITALPLQSAGDANRVASAFFQKPLDLDALLAAIRRQLDVPGSGQSLSPVQS
jgi:DNA-binding NtrC family response regulator